MTESEAREEICRVGLSLFSRGYVHATAGNISIRLAPEEGGGYLITPTDACLGHLDPASLARLDDQGRQVSGARGSKTITLHRAIYQASDHARQPAGCVIHTHSTNLVAATLRQPCDIRHAKLGTRELLPPLTPYFVMKVGHVPWLDYQRPGSPRVAEEVARLMSLYAGAGAPLRAVMLDRLGPNVWGGHPAQAMATLEELEETAKLWLASAGQCAPLTEDQIDDLRQTFGAVW